MSTITKPKKDKDSGKSTKEIFEHMGGLSRGERKALIELYKSAVIDPEVLENAREIHRNSLLQLTLKMSPITTYLSSMAEVIYTDTGGVDTKAVTIDGGGFITLLINPDFSGKIAPKTIGSGNMPSWDVTGDAFVLTHEAYHVILGHLRMLRGVNGVDRELETMAFEAFINYTVIRHAKNAGVALRMPTIDGEVVGIDPKKVWEKYRDDLKSQGIEPMDYEKMFTDDRRVYSELTRMSKPPKFRSKFSVCVHATGTGDDPADGSGQPGDGSGNGIRLDPEEMGKIAERVLEIALHEATTNNNQAVKNELVNLMELTPDQGTFWGDKGFGVLRGETTHTRKTDAWEKWTHDAMASRMDEGERMVYNRKIPWNVQVGFKGDEETKQGLVAIDASGSMSQEVLEKIARIIGVTDKLEITWVSFDGAVWPFVPGEPFKGGGGTSLEPIDAFIKDMDEEPDFCLVLTDGYVPTIHPQNLRPEQWIFLITPGGSEEQIRQNPEFPSIRTIELV